MHQRDYKTRFNSLSFFSYLSPSTSRQWRVPLYVPFLTLRVSVYLANSLLAHFEKNQKKQRPASTSDEEQEATDYSDSDGPAASSKNKKKSSAKKAVSNKGKKKKARKSKADDTDDEDEEMNSDEDEDEDGHGKGKKGELNDMVRSPKLFSHESICPQLIVRYLVVGTYSKRMNT